MNSEVFREYDIRGIVERDFDEAFLQNLGRAYATLIGSGQRVCLGRDGRLHSPRLHDQLLEGMLAGGLEVIDVGLLPTPVLYFSIMHLAADGGIMITGSHNPPEFNGFKICVGRDTIYGDQIQQLRRIMELGQLAVSVRGCQASYDVLPHYLAQLDGRVRLARPPRVVLDAGNGTAGLVAPQALRALGCQVVEMFTEVDGRFPNHFPDPTVPANLEDLRRRVLAEAADVGFAFDGDADRLGVVDERGSVIWGDDLLVIFGRDILGRNPGATVVAEVKCSGRLFADLAARGGRPVMWKSGHSLIRSKMREERALLAGELTGHFFFADRYFGFDDATYAAMRLLEIFSESAGPLSALLKDLPVAHATPEIRIPCPDEAKFEVVSRLTEHFRRKKYAICDIDGARIDFGDGAWGLVRASNTQPVVVIRCEAPTPQRLDKIRSIVQGQAQHEINSPVKSASRPSIPRSERI
ncbi:MAG: phosphomannomutase/phosphoglucomutase [Pseudomonadota bacterium]